MQNNLLTLYGVAADLIAEGTVVSFAEMTVHFRAFTERGAKEVGEAVADVLEGRTAIYVEVIIYRLYPKVMTDGGFDPRPGVIIKGLKWHPVADYVLCILDFEKGQAPADEENQYRTMVLELLEKLVAVSFPTGGLNVALKDESHHHHHEIYVARRDL